jgi:hypothetical protein
VPLPDEIFKEANLRPDLHLFPAAEAVYAMRTSGTVDPTRPSELWLDPVGALIACTSMCAGVYDLLRATGHGDFCASLRFPSFDEAVAHYDRRNVPEYVPTAGAPKPYGLGICAFPDPANPALTPEFNVEHLGFGYRLNHMQTVLCDEAVHTVVPGPEVRPGLRIPPFVADYPTMARLLERRGDKPVWMFASTPDHARIYQAMEEGRLPDLRDGDLFWSGGGDKRASTTPATGTERRKGWACNGLGSTLDGGAFFGRLMRPDETFRVPDWSHFNDAPLTWNLVYTPEQGLLEDGQTGGRLVLDVAMGITRPGPLFYKGDRVAREGKGIRFVGRENR